MANTLSDLVAEMEDGAREWHVTASKAVHSLPATYADGRADGLEVAAAMLRRYIADHGEG